MNNYNNFKKDDYQTAFATTMIIDLQTEDDKIIYIIFNPLGADQEHELSAEVFTAYRNCEELESQFILPCNHGDELAIREMVYGNYINGNLFWAEYGD
jgi:hypothetical protein